jgi:hypothetical protein
VAAFVGLMAILTGRFVIRNGEPPQISRKCAADNSIFAVQREFFPIRPTKFPGAPTVFLFVKLRTFLQSSEKARQVQRG